MSDQTPSAAARVRRRATRQAGAAAPRQAETPVVEDAVLPGDALVSPKPADPHPLARPDPSTEATGAEPAALRPGPLDNGDRWFSPQATRPLLLVALVLILAAAPGATLGVLVYRHHSSQALRDRYTEFAGFMVLALTAYKPDDAAANMKIVANGSSGDFRDEVGKAATDFPRVLQMAGVSSQGRIASEGVENADGHGATVLVAEDLAVKDIGNDAPTARIFQFRVTIQNDNGNLTVTQMEMVS